MIRCDQDNVILQCRELCQQFMVDMCVKIESKRFRSCDSIKKSWAWKILKTIVRYRWWEGYYRWNGMHTITDRFLHNHWFARCSHWPDISQCTQTIHKSWMAGKKSNFSNKKCGRQWIESQDTTIVTRRLGVIQIYWYSQRCY
jgi:hypothetical protein